MNKKLAENKELKIIDSFSSKYAGYFLVNAMFDLLDVENTLNVTF